MPGRLNRAWTVAPLSGLPLSPYFHDDAAHLAGEVVEERLGKLARLLERSGRNCITAREKD